MSTVNKLKNMNQLNAKQNNNNTTAGDSTISDITFSVLIFI